MKTPQVAVLSALLLLAGWSGLDAQAFYPSRVNGTVEVKFLPPAGGQSVQVSIDGQVAGVLPLTVYVVPGAHRFTFFAGEENKTITYPVQGDTTVPSIFTPRAFPLTVNTNVPEASLAIDGRPFGGNSTTATPGQHTLTVSAPGYQVLNMPFNQPRAANILNVTLIGNSFPLTVNVNPAGASLAVDGQPIYGNTTSVAPGDHTLSVNAPGYQNLTLPFSQPSAANILNITLIANTFPLTVNTNPAGASLALDGQPFYGNSISVAPGDHTLTVTAAGYQNLTLPFNQPSAANILNITLIASMGSLRVDTDRLPRTGQAYRLFVNGAETRDSRAPQSLAPGAYSVRLVSGNLSIETSVTVTAGQTVTLIPSVQWETR